MYGIVNLEWMYGNECIGLQLWNGCMGMNAWIANMDLNVWTWMYLIESLQVCKFKFDCEWGNGMGPQGLGMVPWESPSSLLSPTVPWVQWYWTFTGITGI